MTFIRWQCMGCGKVIGAIRKNSSRVPVLYVLDQPMDKLEDDFDWSIKMINGDVKCANCGKIRNWRSIRK